MFTTGTKFLLGSTVVAIIAAIAYGLTQDGVMGTVGLVSAATALALLTGVNLYTRDANVMVTPGLVAENSAAAQLAPQFSMWPLAFAVGGVIVTVGLVTYPAVFILGIVVLFAAGAEWLARAWAERASADSVHNAEVRSRMANPFEFPLAGAIAIGVIVYSFSRIMLWLSKTNTVLAFGILAFVVLSLAFLFAFRPSIKSRAMVSVITIGAIALVAGGVAAGIDGQRVIEPHETTAGAAAEGICEDPGATEADEDASQSVAASASVAAEITLDEAGNLTYDVNGPIPEGQEAVISLPRSNPNNIIFVNNSNDDRRLSADLGTMVVTGASGKDEEVPNQQCTTLVEPDGKQLITLYVAQPSAVFPDGFGFFVPGVDSATLELVVS